MFFLLIKKGKNVHVRPHISKLSLFFFLRPRNVFIIFLSNPKAIYSIVFQRSIAIHWVSTSSSRPYIGRIQSMWESWAGHMKVQVWENDLRPDYQSRGIRVNIKEIKDLTLSWCSQVKWFYHAAETEGTAKGGGRVEDIKTPVGKVFVLLYVEDIRTPISLFNCVCLPCVCVHSNVFIFISRTSILWWLQLCVFLFSFVCNCLGDIFGVLFIFVFVFSCMFVSDKSSISLRILFVCLFLCLL